MQLAIKKAHLARTLECLCLAQEQRRGKAFNGDTSITIAIVLSTSLIRKVLDSQYFFIRGAIYTNGWLYMQKENRSY